MLAWGAAMRPRHVYPGALPGIALRGGGPSSVRRQSPHGEGSSGRERREALGSEDGPPAPRRKIKELGILEGRTRDIRFLHPVKPEPASDEEEGPHAGRNRKKKKHRRLYAVEVQARKIDQTDGLRDDGTLDVGGLVKLAEAQEERAAAPGGIVQQKQWTMEELDRAYPDPEGNKRLGLVNEDDLPPTPPRARHERSSHFVKMRAPGTVAGLIPDDHLNYRRQKENVSLLVMGSMGHLYCVTVQPCWSVGALKEIVWGWERRRRNPKEDEREGFKVHRQRLILDRSMPVPASCKSGAQQRVRVKPGTSDGSELYTLGPDIRLLSWYNITDYDVIMVKPPVPKPTEEEETAFRETCFNAAYEREINRRLGETEDEDDKDPAYRAVKKAYLDACETSFQDLFLSNPHYREGYEELLEKDPNFAFRRHPHLDLQALQAVHEECDRMLAPGFLESIWEEECGAEAARDGATSSLEEDLRLQLSAFEGANLPLAAECVEDMGQQVADRLGLHVPLLPERAQVRLQHLLDADGPDASADFLGLGGRGGAGEGGAQQGVEDGESGARSARVRTSAEVEGRVGERAAAGAPSWVGRQLGIQDHDRYGRPNEFVIEPEFADELRAYKEKLVRDADELEQRRQGKGVERQGGSEAEQGDKQARGAPPLLHPWVDLD
jgi:hypothetical protein